MKTKHLLFSALLSITTFTICHAQTADDIITKHIDAMGGADKLKTVNSLVASGNVNANGTKIPIKITMIQNKGVRVEFTFNGMTGYQILSKDSGWNFSPFQGQTKPEPMTPDDVKKNQDQLDIQDDLFDYKTKGSTVESLGTDEVEGTDCYKLKVTQNNGKEKTYYLGKDDYMTVKVTEKNTVNGKEVESNTMYSNYKPVGDGMKFAFNQNNNMQGEIIFDTVTVNTPVDEKLFKPDSK